MTHNKFSISKIGLAVVVLLIVVSIPLQLKIESIRGDENIITKSLYINSSTLKRLSLGYGELIADIYWIRALQYFSNTKSININPSELYKYFDIITDLDPKFVNAYRFGGSFLADKPPLGLGEIELGVKLFDKGRGNNPENFRIPLDEAFIYFLYTEDLEKSAELFNEASEKKVLSDTRRASIKGMAALAMSKSGNLRLSIEIWTYIYNFSEDENRRNFALQNLIQIKTIEYENQLTEALRNYHKDNNRVPQDLYTLEKKGYIAKFPPLEQYSGEFIIIEDQLLVRNKQLAAEEYRDALRLLNSRSRKFKRVYNRFPKDLEELKVFVYRSDIIKYPKHPYGREFQYNPQTGNVK